MRRRGERGSETADKIKGVKTLLGMALPVLTLSTAYAQEPPTPTLALRQARAEVVYMGSYLRNRAHAETLRLLLNQGGVVKLYTSSYTYLDGGSYFLGLYLAGAELYLGAVPQYFLRVDDRWTYAGKNENDLGATPAPPTQVAEAMRTAIPFTYSPSAVIRGLYDRRRR